MNYGLILNTNGYRDIRCESQLVTYVSRDQNKMNNDNVSFVASTVILTRNVTCEAEFPFSGLTLGSFVPGVVNRLHRH